MKLQFIALCVAWMTCLALAKADESKVVCYYGGWAASRAGNGKFEPSDIDPTLCTHMIYAFVGISTDGEVSFLDASKDAGFKKFNALRENSPGMKTLVAVGGWNEGSTKYSQVMADSTLRRKFVKSAVTFVRDHGFDGFDIDWEYPAQRGGSAADKQNYVLLLEELHASFKPYRLILSAAVGAAESSASISYDIPLISKYLDFINLMTYDFHGWGDSTTGHNAPLYPAARESGPIRTFNINSTVHYWLKQGAPANKLVLGTAFYGKSFTLTNSAQNVPGSPASGAGTAGPYTGETGTLGYNEICESEARGSWTVRWDDEQHVPYAFSGNQWVSFDNVKSITEKANYAKSMGLGGAMLWSIEFDDFRGNCGERYPLLNALNRVLRNGLSTSIPKPSIPTPARPVVPTISGTVNVPKTFGTTEVPDRDDESNIICGSVDQLVRDTQDCAKFWRCTNSADGLIPVQFSCAPGTYFDTNINTCNHQNLVQC